VAGTNNPNWCFVEDTDTSAAILALARHHIPTWPGGAEGAPVYIQVDTEITNLLKPRALKAEFQASDRKALGIVVDAETNLASVWDRVLPFIQTTFRDAVDDLPAHGLVIADENGRRFGIWVMPDNRSPGMLEDFLRHLVPDEGNAIWRFATECVDTARAKGALCREIHLPKARLHTYLAWENPPGERIGIAISKRFLNPHAQTAVTFVSWFKRLYELG
jgi:hypothetical protein